MKIAALILGVLGGIIGLLVSLLGSIIAAVPTGTGPDIGALVWATLGFSILGIVSGSIAIAKPKIAGKLLILSGVGGFISSSIFYIVAGPLLIMAGIFATLGAKKIITREAV